MRQRLSTLGKAAGLSAAAVAALALTGCKDGQGTAQVQPSHQGGTSQSPGTATPAPSSSSGSGAPSKPAGKTKLTVTVRKSKTAKASTYKLACDPATGDLPKAKEACAALDKAATTKTDPFKPTPKGQMCTKIYGGPETATVTGTWNGKKVHATFGRKDGCEIARWAKLAPLFT